MRVWAGQSGEEESQPGLGPTRLDGRRREITCSSITWPPRAEADPSPVAVMKLCPSHPRPFQMDSISAHQPGNHPRYPSPANAACTALCIVYSTPPSILSVRHRSRLGVSKTRRDTHLPVYPPASLPVGLFASSIESQRVNTRPLQSPFLLASARFNPCPFLACQNKA